jgi:hypothetical protein
MKDVIPPQPSAVDTGLPKNHGKPWERENIIALTGYIISQVPPHEAAAELFRTERAVRSYAADNTGYIQSIATSQFESKLGWGDIRSWLGR